MFDVEALKKALAEDKAFAEAYAKIETVEEAVAALKSKGIDVSAEEFAAIAKVVKALKAGNGELDDEALEKVAGGVNIDLSKVTYWWNDPTVLPIPIMTTPIPTNFF